MGYRLTISKLDMVFYGTKLFGYMDDEKVLKSYQYLIKKEYLTGDEFWDYSFDNAIAMLKTDFMEFRELYAQDLRDYNDGAEDSADWFLKETEELTKLPDYEYVVLQWG